MQPIHTEIKEFNIGDVRIEFLDSEGNAIKKSSTEPIMSHRWVAHIDGIESYRIKSIELPKLDYSNLSPLTVKVELYPKNLFGEA